MIITETNAEHHDRVMSVVQVLTHFQTQVMGLTLARLGLPLEESRRFTSPVYLLELYTTARHFAQASSLYGPIEMRNPRVTEVTSAFRAVAAELAGHANLQTTMGYLTLRTQDKKSAVSKL